MSNKVSFSSSKDVGGSKLSTCCAELRQVRSSGVLDFIPSTSANGLYGFEVEDGDLGSCCLDV